MHQIFLGSYRASFVWFRNSTMRKDLFISPNEKKLIKVLWNQAKVQYNFIDTISFRLIQTLDRIRGKHIFLEINQIDPLRQRKYLRM